MSDWQYKVPEECDESIYDLPECPYEKQDVQYAASFASENHWGNHDYWEHGLPSTIKLEMIYKGKSLGVFKVFIEPDVHHDLGLKL